MGEGNTRLSGGNGSLICGDNGCKELPQRGGAGVQTLLLLRRENAGPFIGSGT